MTQKAKKTKVFDYRGLYKTLERTLYAIEHSQDLDSTLAAILEGIVTEFREELGFTGGRLYAVEVGSVVLKTACGKTGDVRPGYRIPRTYPPIQTLLKEGFVLMTAEHPDFDRSIEGSLGIDIFAAICVGNEVRHIISFTVEGVLEEERILHALNAIRHVINLKLDQQKLVNMFLEARDIQMSLLPAEAPEFWGFDFAGRMVPAETVGGDLFDYIPISDRILGFAVADSAGHGLPAALQARDVITGMRMGLEEDMKIIRTVQKLNRVIHRSNLATKFVSLFYGELERNGNFVYCNAGHPPPLLYQNGSFKQLDLGGIVLGPTPDAKYERGFLVLRPGDILVLYSDGVSEAGSLQGKEFGLKRIEDLIRKLASRPAAAIVDGILQAVEEYCGPDCQHDDRTLVVIKPPPAEPAAEGASSS